jgi:steroid 5-alpha reductase family enzyme
MLLVGWLAASALMLLLWLVHLAIRNAGIVDVGWSFAMGGLALFYAIAGPGDWIRRLLIGLLGGFWGARLGIYLLKDRVIGRPEDGRYQTIRARWGDRASLYFLPFFLAQAVVAAILSAPFLLATFHDAPAPSVWDIIAVGLWVIAQSGESLADWQLVRFKADATNRGKTCRAGLWRYSRHPNYFFEWLHWIAYAVFALPAPFGWLGLISPAVMLYLLFRVTGIPATEAQAIRSRGDDYREYQRTTSAFVPWFPAKESK